MDQRKRFDLDGRAAVVTGSSRGIGAAMAEGLAAAGADVVVHCAGNVEAGQAVATRIRDQGRRAMVVRADLADPDAADQIVEAIGDFGPIDILVHNASMQFREGWSGISRGHVEQQLRVNLQAVFDLNAAMVPAMTDRGWGRVLTIGSVQQHRPHPQMPVYAASKSALENATRHLARELADVGVTVNNLAPGVIDTDRNREALSDPTYRQHVIDQIPMRRFGATEDCVGAALLLCTDAGAYITGQTIYVDGGLTL